MSPLAMILLAVLGTSAIVAGRYFAISGAFHWLTQRRRPGSLHGLAKQIRREIGWSLTAALIYGLPAGVVLWGWANRGWTRIYSEAGAYPLWWLPVSFLLYLLAHDAWFYWTHRLLHRPALFRRYHAVHHAGRRPTAWTAMSFHPGESVTGAIIIPLLVFLVPIHIGVLGAVLTAATLMGVTNHLGWEIFPRRWVLGRAGRWIITASHHQRHHEHYGCNFGLYFRHWDRWCGTDKGLSDRV